MSISTVSVAVKTAAAGVAAGGVAASLLDLNWLSVASALVGAGVSYHFDDAKAPSRLPALLFGIFATGFAAAFVAAASPALPWLGWTGAIDIALRAGLLGISIRFLVEQGKRLLRGYRRAPGEGSP